MTHVQKSWLQKWLPTVVAVIAVAGNVLFVGRWSATTEARIGVVETHAQSDSVHMPWDKKIEVFMTRREVERADTELRETLNKIEGQIDYLYKKAQNNAAWEGMSTPSASN